MLTLGRYKTGFDVRLSFCVCTLEAMTEEDKFLLYLDQHISFRENIWYNKIWSKHFIISLYLQIRIQIEYPYRNSRKHHINLSIFASLNKFLIQTRKLLFLTYYLKPQRKPVDENIIIACHFSHIKSQFFITCNKYCRRQHPRITFSMSSSHLWI